MNTVHSVLRKLRYVLQMNTAVRAAFARKSAAPAML